MRFLSFVACLMLPCVAAAQTDNPGAGIPLAVADARAAWIGNLRYDLRLTVPEAATAAVEGTTTIALDLKTAAEPLVIDFATSREHVKSVTANGTDAAFTWVNGHIV